MRPSKLPKSIKSFDTPSFRDETRTNGFFGQDSLIMDQKAAPNALAALVAALGSAGISDARIAIDERGLGSTFLKELEEAVPKAKFVPGDLLLRRIRSVKTEDELKLIIRVMEITEGAIQEFYSQAREEMTEEEAIRIFDGYLVSQGAHPKFSNIYFGHHSAIGHVARRDATLRGGEVGRLDVGCTYQGYNSDLARSFSWGEPHPRALAYYRATLVGQDNAVAAMRPGVPAKKVFQIGVEAVRANGIPHFQRTHIGHAVGLEVYDLPTLSPGDETELEEGMTFEVELPYYEMGFEAIQPEDTVLVTKEGGKILTSLPRDFKILG